MLPLVLFSISAGANRLLLCEKVSHKAKAEARFCNLTDKFIPGKSTLLFVGEHDNLVDFMVFRVLPGQVLKKIHHEKGLGVDLQDISVNGRKKKYAFGDFDGNGEHEFGFASLQMTNAIFYIRKYSRKTKKIIPVSPTFRSAKKKMRNISFFPFGKTLKLRKKRIIAPLKKGAVEFVWKAGRPFSDL